MLFPVSAINIKEIINSIDIQKRARGNQSRKNNDYYYKDVVCAFDIETTRYKIGEHNVSKTKVINDEVAIMYIWQFQIGLNITIYGRTWDEFRQFCDDMQSVLKDNERLVIYIHNASYEFSFLRDKRVLGDKINEPSVFILSSRKVLRFMAYGNKLEFRCSLIHSNMSLDEFTDKMKVEHKKLSGQKFNYDIMRFPWTELTDYELNYCINDVLGLVECIYKEMEIDGDNLYTIPLTSTGYVRRDMRKAINEHLPRGYIKERKPDYKTYCLLREAFRGGNTHANRGISGKTISGKIEEYDRSSSYPDVQVNGKFPISSWSKPRRIDKDGFLKCIARGYCVIARLELLDVELVDEFVTVPYISESNCTLATKTELDNGRILKAERIIISVTEYDLEIIDRQYNYRWNVLDYRVATKGDLPEPIKDVIRNYYSMKTKLKGDDTQKIQYMKSKNKLNAIYGNSAQDGGRIGIIYDGGQYKDGFRDRRNGEKYIFTEENAEMLSEMVYELTDTVLPYSWGVYTTSIARAELQKMIDICGDNFLYCDTDSVYFVQDGTISFDEYNKNKIEQSIKNKAFAEDVNKKLHYMGVAEKEDYNITSFRTMGAKKYCFIYDEDSEQKMKLTVSGVSKKYGVHELVREWAKQDRTSNPLNLFDDGFIFRKAGGTEVVYNDVPSEVIIDGKYLYVPTNAVIRPSTYEVGLGEDYLPLLASLGSLNTFNLIFREHYKLTTAFEIFL